MASRRLFTLLLAFAGVAGATVPVVAEADSAFGPKQYTRGR